MNAKQCEKCGTEFSPELPQGLCPACLLESAMSKLEPAAEHATQGFPESPVTQPIAFAPDEKPSDRIGRYKLLEKIGVGGCGVVWMAEQTEPVRRRVALKVIKLGMDTKEVIARFEAERQALALMDHPNIAKIHDAGTTSAGRPYFVMELVRGIPITRYCDEANLSTERRLQLFIQVCHAIQHAHQKGVIHRDIKPSNILVAQHDDVAVPKVIDFGIAKATQGPLTEATVFTAFEQFIGTPAYMSPEQAEFSGLDIDTRSDIYSLGVLLYELLSGRPPFDPKSMQKAGLDEIRRIIREVEPPRPSTRLKTLALSDRTTLAKLHGTQAALLSSQLQGDLDWIVMKALEKNRTRRYETASGLALDLQRHLRHEPVVARPPNAIYVLQKLIRRNAAAVALAGVVVLVTALVGVSVKYATLPPPASPSLAVLFRSADADSKYLTTEFARNLIHSLGHLPGVKVAPRSAVLKWEGGSARPEEAGKALGVPAILSGTFQQKGDAFELRAELIAVGTGARIWDRTFREHLANGVALQTQLVRIVATKLGVELGEKNRAESRRSLTAEPEAWLHYLRARQHRDAFSEPNLLKAIAEFEQAIARDPEFAQAYAGLADAHFDLGYTFRDPAVHLPKAKAYVREALKRDETLVEAIIVDGAVKYFFDWDWPAAASAVKQAVLLDPSALENHACYLHSLETIGRLDEALQMVRLASAHHPSSIGIQSELGCSAYYAAKFDEAAAYWEQARKNDPENWYLDWGFGRTLAQQGKYQNAATVLEAAQRKPGGDWTGILTELAYVRAREGRHDEARVMIQQLRARAKDEYVDPYLFAMAYAGLAEAQEMFRHLDLAVKGRSSWIPSFPVDPKFAPFRSDPRFQQLLVSLKLPSKV